MADQNDTVESGRELAEGMFEDGATKFAMKRLAAFFREHGQDLQRPNMVEGFLATVHEHDRAWLYSHARTFAALKGDEHPHGYAEWFLAKFPTDESLTTDTDHNNEYALYRKERGNE